MDCGKKTERNLYGEKSNRINNFFEFKIYYPLNCIYLNGETENIENLKRIGIFEAWLGDCLLGFAGIKDWIQGKKLQEKVS